MKTNIRYVIIVLMFGMLVCLVPGRAVAKPYSAREKREFLRRQKRVLNEAEELFLKGDYKGVTRACEDIFYIARRYKSKRGHLDKLYYIAAVSYLKLNDTTSSRAYLYKIISSYSNSTLVPDAYLALGDAYYTDEDYDESSNMYMHFTRTYPRDPSVPQAYLRLGQIARKLGRREEAKYYLDKVREDYPMSFEAKITPLVSSGSGGYFSVQLGYFSSIDNARKLKNELERKGYYPYIVEVRSSGNTYYRVRIGKEDSRVEAKYLAEKLRKQGFEAKIHP